MGYNHYGKRHPWGLYTIAGTVLGLISMIGSCECANRYEYSTGTRTGMINKISRRGLFWKTFEGQMALEGIVSGGSQTGANVWDFSIDGSERQGEDEYLLAKKVEDALKAGTKVRVTYREPFWKWPWRGDTAYFIQNIESMNTESAKEDIKKDVKKEEPAKKDKDW